jgi:hypothetical protein
VIDFVAMWDFLAHHGPKKIRLFAREQRDKAAEEALQQVRKHLGLMKKLSQPTRIEGKSFTVPIHYENQGTN